MRHLLVLALASACVAADPPTALPDLVLERGETLVYAYPPYDSLASSDPRIVRVVERGKGVVELVGTMAGTVDVKLEATVGGAGVAYVGRIEVLLPLADVITDAICATHKDLTPAEQQRAGVEFLSRARGLYRDRARDASNLYRAYEFARQAWSLLELHGPRSARVLDAASLMDAAKDELDTAFAKASTEIQEAIQARDWPALGAKLDALLQLVPDSRDGRHQRARKLRDFYADFFGVRGSDAGRGDDVRAAQFRNAVQMGVAEMQKANHRDAAKFFGAANDVEESTTVQSLIRLNSLLEDRPTDHIDAILEITSEVMRLTHDTWIKTGVIELARTMHEKWTRKRDNAKRASLGDECFDQSRYREALDHYDQIARDSELHVVRRGKIETCKSKLADALRDDAKALLRAAFPEEAIVKLKAAMELASHDRHNELINLLGAAENNTKYAQLLRKGREELRQGNVDAAKQFLEQIPDKSIYFKDAASELESMGLKRFTTDAEKLFALGEGEKVLALLKAASDPSLVAFREKVDSVHQIYLQAKELYEAEKYRQANDLWDTLKRMVGDPTNQYYKWAEAGLKVDPANIAEEHAQAAQEAFAVGKFVEAARFNSRALKFDPKNAMALKLRGTIERQVTLRYLIERQKWESGNIDNPAFLTFALEQYVLLRAANAIHPQLAQMAQHIKRCGGEVPPEEKEGEGGDK